MCERLRISEGSSYRIIPAGGIPYMTSDRLIGFLNRSRKGREEELTFIPSDILTPEEASEETGIPVHKLLIWTRRKKKIPPHFRFTKQLTRFRRSSLSSWLERISNG